MAAAASRGPLLGPEFARLNRPNSHRDKCWRRRRISPRLRWVSRIGFASVEMAIYPSRSALIVQCKMFCGDGYPDTILISAARMIRHFRLFESPYSSDAHCRGFERELGC